MKYNVLLRNVMFLLLILYNKNNPSYKNYGGKGISYSEDWADFRNFYADMGKRPVKSAKLERYDKTKNFTKDNCYWKRK